MNNDVVILVLLVGIIVFQQLSIHRLVNKLMSRNFHEYETAVNLKKEETTVLKQTEDIPEDIRHLQETFQPF